MSVRTAVKSIQDIMRQDTGVDGDAQRISQLCWMFFLKIIDDQDQELELLDPEYRSPIPAPLQWRTWASDPEGITGEGLLTFVNNTLFPALKDLTVDGGAHRRRVVRDVFQDAYNYMKSGQLMRQVINKINEVDFNDLAERQHFGEIYEQVLNDLQSAGNAGEYYTPRAVTAFMADRIDPRPGEVLLDPACGTGGFLTCAIRHMRKNYVRTVEDEKRMQQALRAVEKKQLPHMLCVTNMLLHGINDPSFVRHDNTLARPYVSYGSNDRVDIVLTNPPFGGREEDGIEANFPKQFQTRETADLFLALIIRLLRPGGRAAVVLPDGTLFGEGVKTRLKEHLLEECNVHTIVRLPNSVFKPYASIGTNLLFFEKGGPTKEIWYYEHRVPEGQKAYSMTKPIRLEHFHECVAWWGGSAREGRSKGERAWKVTLEEIRARGYNLDVKNPATAAADHGDPAQWLLRLTDATRAVHELQAELRNTINGSIRVDPAGLLANAERLLDSRDAVPPLRRLIKDLAVRGRLVEQRVDDEPAATLLEEIARQRGADTSQRRGNRRVLQDVTSDPFPVPTSWKWARFADIAAIESNLVDPKGYETYPHVAPDNIESGTGRLLPYDTIGASGVFSAKHLFRPGSLLYSKIRPALAKVVAVDFEGLCSADMYPVRAFIDRGYLQLFMLAEVFIRQSVTEDNRVAMPKINQEALSRILVAVPPLAEQRRIVARAASLETICVRLENAIATRDDARARALTACVIATLGTTEGSVFA